MLVFYASTTIWNTTMTDLNSVLNVENNKLVARGDLSVYGILNASKIYTNELIAHQRYDGQFIEFSVDNETGSNAGTGFLWPTPGGVNKQFLFVDSPDRFHSSENLELADGKAFYINGGAVLTEFSIGGSVVESNLQTVGTLRSLGVAGAVDIDSTVFYNADTRRVGINISEPNGLLSVYDPTSDVEVVISTDVNGRGRFGTHHARSLDIVTDEQARISVEGNGDVQIGQEWKDSTVTRIYGKTGLGVKNPREQLEVAGNIRFADKLFAVGAEAPTEGTYKIGDIVYNTEPKAGGYVGWVCTYSGTPGVWKPFGHIAD